MKVEDVDKLQWYSSIYLKHMPHYHRSQEWGQVVKETGGKKPVGRYIHSLSPVEIEEMERGCIRYGIKHPDNQIIEDTVFWQNTGMVIGANGGEQTTYLRVEISGGGFHGRPVTKKQLQKEIGHEPC